ncbi:MAG: trehalase family glycosidase [Kiritimatiellia bacterium]|jgi:hypothetical protein|nr:trehalase family glycosidase [Kiritimatiellia bacterium]MDP7022778.1 trehalase family glycosidase [Kiritimatiellia bacterium]
MFNIGNDTWRELAAKHGDLSDLMKNGIFTDEATGKDYFTGYGFNRTLYDWDQYFEAVVQLYLGWEPTYISNGIEIFLDHQREDGFIARVVPLEDDFHGSEHVKPFLCQSAVLLHRAGKGSDWLTPDYFQKLQKYLDYWLVDMDTGNTGLSEWMSSLQTGMDNQHERAGYWRDRMSKGVDLNAFLIRECRAFACLAGLRGDDTLAQVYRRKADQRAERMRELMWDEETGLFYDLNVGATAAFLHGDAEWQSQTTYTSASSWAAVNVRIGLDMQLAKEKGTAPMMRVKYAGIFATLWAGVATPEQAGRMISEHLMNRDEFWSDYPVAVLAKSERWYMSTQLPADIGCSWRANTWMPTNYYIFQALRSYGYPELATRLVDETMRLLNKSGNREYFCSETGEGRGLDPFWGWTLLGWFMPFEDEHNLDPTTLESCGDTSPCQHKRTGR